MAEGRPQEATERVIDAPAADVARTTTLIASTVLALAALLVLAWLSATALLIVFAGILLAVALDGAARALGRVMGGSHRLRLGLVIMILAVLLGGALAWGGATLFTQFDELSATIREQVGKLTGAAETLATGGAGQSSGQGSQGAQAPQGSGTGPVAQPDEQSRSSGQSQSGRGGLSALLPDLRSLFGGASNAIFSLFGALGNFVVVIFLGIFLAANPGPYKAGLLSLLPKDQRPRTSEVLDGSAEAMRSWLKGQSVSMTVIFVVTWALLALIGMPFAFLMALQSGLLVFIPTLGPAISGVIIVLAGLAESPTMGLYGLGVYALIQFLESYLLEPYVVKRTVHLPPALTIAVQLVMGALFGILGIALAVPFAAACKTWIEELYVKDALGGPWRGEERRS
jgi:predicted PurR-regulated permease PerM